MRAERVSYLMQTLFESVLRVRLRRQLRGTNPRPLTVQTVPTYPLHMTLDGAQHTARALNYRRKIL
jgi:hypothetical protein